MLLHEISGLNPELSSFREPIKWDIFVPVIEKMKEIGFDGLSFITEAILFAADQIMDGPVSDQDWIEQSEESNFD